MRLCPYCEHHNLEGVLYCDDCGTPLLGDDVVEVKASFTKQLKVTTDRLSPNDPMPIMGGTAILKETTLIVLRFENNQRVSLEQQSESVLGRSDERSKTYPDVDLTPYGALEKGVSRNHAAIRRNEDTVTITDLGSANGTFLNGRQLIANQPHVLRDGDEIRFGKLATHVFFK